MAKKDDEARQILPGPKRIPVLDGQVEALVYPLGFRHLKKFNEKITRVMVYLARNVKVPAGASEDEVFSRVLIDAVPLVISDLLDLIEDCVTFNPQKIKMDDLPHWDLPILIEEWLMESFGEVRKRDPWMRAIESTVVRFTGKEIKLSQILSKASSQADGATETSSESVSQESRIED